MSKQKFKFNPDTLSYDQKEDSRAKKVLNIIFVIILFAILIAAALIVVLPYFSETPQERVLVQEVKILEEEYQKLQDKKKVADKYLKELKDKDKQIYKQIFEAKQQDPISKKKDVYKQMRGIGPLKFTKRNADILDSLKIQISAAEKETAFLLQLVQSQKTELQFIPAIQPIYNPNLELPVSGFGILIDPVYKSPAFHKGIDYAAPRGTPVYATADGKVTHAGRKRTAGLVVRIDHGNGYITEYAHLNKIDAQLYSVVKRGNVIGYVGNSGKSFSEHLHYEIRYNGTPINPVNYFFLDLSFENYAKMIEKVKKAGISLD